MPGLFDKSDNPFADLIPEKAVKPASAFDKSDNPFADLIPEKAVKPASAAVAPEIPLAPRPRMGKGDTLPGALPSLGQAIVKSSQTPGSLLNVGEWQEAAKNILPHRIVNRIVGNPIDAPMIPPEVSNPLIYALKSSAGDIAGGLPGATPGFRKAIEGEAKSVGEGVASTINPDVIAALTTGGTSALASTAVKAAFVSQMLSAAPDATKQVMHSLKYGDEAEIAKSLGDLAQTVGIPVGILKEGLKPAKEPIPLQGRQIPMPKGAMPTSPEAAAPKFAGETPPPTLKPEVPSTPPEPEREENVIQEIRRKGLTTRRQVQSLFPHLSNEEAAELRNQAWGKPVPTPPKLEPKGAVPPVQAAIEKAAPILPQAAKAAAEAVAPKVEPKEANEPTSPAPAVTDKMPGGSPAVPPTSPPKAPGAKAEDVSAKPTKAIPPQPAVPTAKAPETGQSGKAAGVPESTAEFIGSKDAGDTHGDRTVVGNYRVKRTALAEQRLSPDRKIEGYSSGKYKRGWIVTEPKKEGGTPTVADTTPAAESNPQPVPTEPKGPGDTDKPLPMGPGASNIRELRESGGPSGKTEGYGGDIGGIAQRVREERAKAGQVAPVNTGQGVSAEETVKWGRDLLQNGADPEKALSQFEKDKKTSYDLIAVTRAHGDALIKAAENIKSKFGNESSEYKLAYKALSGWDARTKTIQTEWHKQGMAQQGETDIDTGTFTGLQRAFHEATGRDLTPSQGKTALHVAEGVAKAEKAAEAVKPTLQNAIDNLDENGKPRYSDYVLKWAEKLVSKLDARADASRKALGDLTRTFGAGVDPAVLIHVANIGAAHIGHIGLDFVKWSKAMVDDFGPKIQPHLEGVFEASRKVSDGEADKLGSMGEQIKKVISKKGAAQVPADLAGQREAFSDYKPGMAMNPKQVKTLWTRALAEYIDKGVDTLPDIVQKLSEELGLTKQDVLRGLAQSKSIKRVADDLWQKQKEVQRLRQNAKQWVKDANTVWLSKVVPSIARKMFALKVGGHGFVAIGTHAPLTAFTHPIIAAKNFGQMYRMVLSPEYHDMMMHDLTRRPNYSVGQRNGLVNDPHKFEDFSNPKMAQQYPALAKYFQKIPGISRLPGAGTRG